ncbi:MAG: hypothetical protein ACREUL_09720 [Steroidobacteraceae bacterium]
MNIPKPRIRPKTDRYPMRNESPLRDAPSYPERDPPIFTERDPGAEQKAAGRVIFYEDDCLR